MLEQVVSGVLNGFLIVIGICIGTLLLELVRSFRNRGR